MDTKHDGKNIVKSVEKSFIIVERIQALNGATVTELADELDVAKSTVHKHLRTLDSLEYVRRVDDEYHVGLKFLDHGIVAKEDHVLTGVIQPTLDDLAESTGEVAWVVVEDHGRAVTLEISTGERGVRTLDRVGIRTPLHYHAAARVILAHLPDQRVEEIIDRHGLPKVPNSSALFADLEKIRERGYALMDNLAVDGLRSVAAPIMHRDEVVGSIAVAGPAKRFRGDRYLEEFPGEVLGAANAIELKLSYE